MLKEEKRLQECKMVMVCLVAKENEPPFAIAITTAPSKREAEKHAREELKPYTKLGLMFHTKSLGSILYPPFPTTIFLYIQGPGRMK